MATQKLEDKFTDPIKFCLALGEELKAKEGTLTAGDVEMAITKLAKDAESKAKDLKSPAHPTRVSRLLAQVLKSTKQAHILAELAKIYNAAGKSSATQSEAINLMAMGKLISDISELSASDKRAVKIANERFGVLAAAQEIEMQEKAGSETKWEVSFVTGLKIEIRNRLNEFRERCHSLPEITVSFMKDLDKGITEIEKEVNKRTKLDDLYRFVLDLPSSIANRMQTVDNVAWNEVKSFYQTLVGYLKEAQTKIEQAKKRV